MADNQNIRNIKDCGNGFIRYLKGILQIINETKQQKVKLKKHIKEIIGQLTSAGIDIKNEGSKKNSLEVRDSNVSISAPERLSDDHGQGKFATGSSLQQYIKIKIIKDGELSLSFGSGCSLSDNKQIPVWIDYKSVKIDGKEILSCPVSGRFDKPFNYLMPVKDGQEIILECEQQYHRYTENELRDIILQLNADNNFATVNADKILKGVARIVGKTAVTPLKNFPQIKADCFIPLGIKCRAAEWLKRRKLRYCSLPFDWLAQYNLQFVCQSINNGIDDWFAQYRESPQESDGKHRCVYDTKNNFRARHIFPPDKTIEEYIPTFKKTFSGRYERLLKILQNSAAICFVCSNRVETVYELYLFIRKIQELYPNKTYTVLSVHHNENEQSVTEYKFKDKIVIYNIEAPDLYKSGEGKSNALSWIGNEDLWVNICKNLSLSEKSNKFRS